MPEPRHHSQTRSRIKRVAIYLTASIVMLAIVGAGYQRVGEARDRREAPAPGRMVTVGGHRMHLHCSGDGAPTVILEAGATGFAQTWSWIQPQLAQHARVCSYDRAGMGWSDDWETGHDARTIARQLKQLLVAAGEEGPYVMIGHSLGGSLLQAYYGIYPDDVVALGLVDPSHPDQLERFGPEVQSQQRAFQSMIGYASKLGHVGLLRATNILGRLAQGLPEADYRSARMFAASPRHLRTSHAEMLAWDATMDAARKVRTFEDRPVLVISATEAMEGMPEDMLDINHDMHGELAAMSRAGRHVKLRGTDHYSLLMNREHALQTASLIEELIDAVRSR